MNNSYLRTIAQFDKGYSTDEASSKLAELIKAVRATGRGGKLTFELSVSPASRGAVNTLKLTGEVKAKMPKLPAPECIMFATDDNTLQKTDPNQTEMELRVAQAPEAMEPRVAKGAETEPRRAVNQ